MSVNLLPILLLGLIWLADGRGEGDSALEHLCYEWSDSSLKCRPSKGDFRPAGHS